MNKPLSTACCRVTSGSQFLSVWVSKQLDSGLLDFSGRPGGQHPTLSHDDHNCTTWKEHPRVGFQTCCETCQHGVGSCHVCSQLGCEITRPCPTITKPVWLPPQWGKSSLDPTQRARDRAGTWQVLAKLFGTSSTHLCVGLLQLLTSLAEGWNAQQHS